MKPPRLDGRVISVVAHKHPDVWDSLGSAMIRTGFVMEGSRPIRTEIGDRTRTDRGCGSLHRATCLSEAM